MTFPVVEATATSEETSSTATHNITLPSGIAAGDTLIAIIAINAAAVVTWPSGWTQFYNQVNGSNLRLAAAWRKATGSEGATVDPTSSPSQTSSHQAYRISGAADPTVTPPEASAGVSGSSSTPNPDTLTPIGGAKDYLWLAIECHSIGTTTSSAPASYTNLVAFKRVGSARRNLNAANTDPGTFGLSGSVVWIAGTIAVHPLSGLVVTMSGAIAPAGANVGKINAGFAGGITPVGIHRALMAKLFGGSLTPSGSLAFLTPFVVSLAGTITPTGAIATARSLAAVLTGTITPVGQHTGRVLQSFAGAISLAGTVVGVNLKTFTGTITPTGSISLLRNMFFEGLIEPAGTLLGNIHAMFAGTIAPTGILSFLVPPLQIVGRLRARITDRDGTPRGNILP